MEQVSVEAAAALVAVAAGVRGLWSPCGLSMLSTITPIGERSRGARYPTTAAWYVGGAVAGGASLGCCMAVVALGVATWHPGAGAVAALGGVSAVTAMASDARLGGVSLPVHRRQVNERWLDRYRPWVYGAGFGWQIGTGLCTYIVTAANYLLVVLAGLSGSPLAALALGTVFGLVRGLTVLASRDLRSFAALQLRHRWVQRTGPFVRDLTIAAEGVAAMALVAAVAPLAAGVVALAMVAVFVATAPQRRSPACSLDASRG